MLVTDGRHFFQFFDATAHSRTPVVMAWTNIGIDRYDDELSTLGACTNSHVVARPHCYVPPHIQFRSRRDLQASKQNPPRSLGCVMFPASKLLRFWFMAGGALIDREMGWQF